MVFKVSLRIIFTAFILAITSVSLAWAGGAAGSTAPGLTLPDISGKKVSLENFRGRVVFIDFWASWCKPCKKELPELNAFIKGYDADKVVVLAINIDKKRSHAESFLMEIPDLSDKMTILFDPEGRVISEYKARAMPTSFIVDGDGVIRHVHFGFNEDDPLKWAAEIDALLGEPVR